ncbi:hypothetical protein H4Q32_030264 [Labeo rohita]|uniref:Uncharacterized protein n=1 Tax=Labeo rohita TaxID=84645 RepID=A0ABQ8M4Y8_LABRO|nr:hypothetical protein H4Q32_030264 [Labeo rohita]
MVNDGTVLYQCAKFHNFPAIGSMGCHRLPERKKRKKKNNKNANGYNRCHRTFGNQVRRRALDQSKSRQKLLTVMPCQHELLPVWWPFKRLTLPVLTTLCFNKARIWILHTSLETRYRILHHPKIQRLSGTQITMDPASHLFCLRQGNQPTEDYVVDFCGLCHLVAFNDDCGRETPQSSSNPPYHKLLTSRLPSYGLLTPRLPLQDLLTPRLPLQGLLTPRLHLSRPPFQSLHQSQAKPQLIFMSQTNLQQIFMSQVKSQLIFLSQVKSRQTSLSQVKSRQTFQSQVQSQQTLLNQSRHISADPLESRRVSADLPEPRCVSADPLEPRRVSADPLEPTLPSHAEPALPSHMSAPSTPSRPAGIPLSTVLPVMAVAILSVWATHCAPEASSVLESAPEASSVHKSAPEASSVHESAPEASSVHKSAPEASSVHGSVPESFPAHEFAPIPLEVSACSVEPPKEVASTHELTATSNHESVPMPPEVVAPATEPSMGAASNYELSARHVTVKKANHELSAHHVTAKEAYHELSACHVMAKEANHEPYVLLWMSLVPLWIFLLLSALPALSVPPWLPVLPALHAPLWLPALHAPPWLPVLPAPPWHCLSLLHDPGPPPLHGPGPPSHPLFCLCSPTLLDCCCLSTRSRSWGGDSVTPRQQREPSPMH